MARTDKPLPSPPNPVPRAWLTVIRLALAAQPTLALSGLWALLQGKRVRGWNRLSLAAAANRGCYRAWIREVEPTQALPADAAGTGLVGAIILGETDSDTTRASLKRAFGDAVPIFVASAPLPERDRPRWLLPIHAGDCVSPKLGAVLAGATRNEALIYWDEDVASAQGRTAPWIKPDWDPLLFGAHDGLIGSCAIRGTMLPVAPVAGWSAFARTLANAAAPAHLPCVLTHRANLRVPAAPQPAAAPTVSVSVVIPTRDRADLLDTCLGGLSRTTFPGTHDIIIVDNGSTDPATKALFERVEVTGQARVISHPGPFNFAALANAGVAASRSDLACLLNNDVEIVAPDWLERMAVLAVRDDIGAVGARLLYPDGAIQHAGVALGIGGAAGHVERGVIPVPGRFSPWHGETRTVSAVTAACLLVDRAKFEAIGGMDAQTFTIDFNDVDLCVRLAERGWRTVYCADATLTHHESRSRGRVRLGADLLRFERELAALRSQWSTSSVVDPYHSPLFRRDAERCLLAF